MYSFLFAKPAPLQRRTMDKRQEPSPAMTLQTQKNCIFLEKFATLRQNEARTGKQRRFSREIRHSPPIVLVGGGVWRTGIVFDVRAFLTLRQLSGLAEDPRV